jgi:hypothetical protein
VNPKLEAAKERRRLALTTPDVQKFEKSLPAIIAAVVRFGGPEHCFLNIHSTVAETGAPDAWWEVVPTDRAKLADGEDPPSGDESHPCPPFLDC